MKRRLLTIGALVLLVALASSAQERLCFERVPCVHGEGMAQRATTRGLPPFYQDWNPLRVYRQAVILVQYADMAFSMSDPKTYYHELLNVSSSNTRGGVGCAADYFRDQSKGQFNAQFDVIGPVKVSHSAQNIRSYAEDACREALKKAVDSLHVDFSPYDWDGDNSIEQITFIMSGYCANGGGSAFSKYVWPNTNMFYNEKVTEKLKVGQFSVSAEKWFNGNPCGIGTFCHEYSHCLGLPDIYPTSGGGFTQVDEWDLMDGGNYTAWGWCPPNYSALERSLLGWLTFEEITGPMTVADLKPVDRGGKAYKMVKQGDEFYVLENRQQSGWDSYLPGKGLLIAHVYFDQNAWRYNTVNAYTPKRYDLLHADGMDYEAWELYVKAKGLTAYVDTEKRLCRRHLSTSPYPLLTDTLEVHECADLPLPLTNIQLSADGRISFEVVTTGMNLAPVLSQGEEDWYDLQGRRLQGRPQRRGIYIHKGKKESIR